MSIAIGYNSVFGSHHKNIYTDQDSLCANFIRDIRLAPDLNSHLSEEVQPNISLSLLYLIISFSLYCTYGGVFLKSI